VNQCWLSGDVWIKDTAGTRKLSDGGMYDNIEWVWHDGVGYCFEPGQQVVVRSGPQEGGWDRIMAHSDALEYRETLPRDLSNRPIFSLWIEHGLSVRNASYQYAIFQESARTRCPALLPAAPLSSRQIALVCRRFGTRLPDGHCARSTTLALRPVLRSITHAL